jgi:hypothetical protein
MKTSRIAIVGLSSLLFVTAACSSTTATSPSTTAAPGTTAASKNFQVSTPDGQVSLSLDGNLPPNWPADFPVPSGATAAGSGSLGGSSSTTSVAVYTTGQSASDVLAFYTGDSKLTTASSSVIGAGSTFVGSVKITDPYTAGVTSLSRGDQTYLVITLKTSTTGTSAP